MKLKHVLLFGLGAFQITFWIDLWITLIGFALMGNEIFSLTLRIFQWVFPILWASSVIARLLELWHLKVNGKDVDLYEARRYVKYGKISVFYLLFVLIFFNPIFSLLDKTICQSWRQFSKPIITAWRVFMDEEV